MGANVENFDNENEFIEATVEHFGFFHEIETDEWKIRKFIPVRDLDVMVYGPFTVSDERHIVLISWKMEGDVAVEERLREYADNLVGPQWSICKWPRAEGGVNIDHFELKNTHHRCMMIWYQ